MDKICLYCKEVLKKYWQKKYCSRICANKGTAKQNSLSKTGKKNPMFGRHAWNYKKFGIIKGKRGSENHFWKGGKSDDAHKARQSGAWKKWRLAVYKRDNYTCQICKIKGGKLMPHHIKLYRFFVKDRYKVGNGVTLCSKHHRELHNRNINKKIINIYD